MKHEIRRWNKKKFIFNWWLISLQDYVHRVGRTGRAGNKGFAYTFVLPEREYYFIIVFIWEFL